ncbi:TcpQ domain-containing protein [Burkholderia gladioli]|uniref:TcpQ domain-containing protein n=1 Tax=Burkholderia gladioli TaxID=28095 RepID=UPI0034DB4A87
MSDIMMLQLPPFLRRSSVLGCTIALAANCIQAAPVETFQPARDQAFDQRGWQPVESTAASTRPGEAMAGSQASTPLQTAVSAPAAPSGTERSVVSAGDPQPGSPGLRAGDGSLDAPATHTAASLSARPDAAAPLPLASSPAVPSLDAKPAVVVYRLQGGLPIEAQLMAWAKPVHWTVLWNLPPDANWIVPGDMDFGTDFEDAIAQVVRILASNGADIRGHGHRLTRTFVIQPAGNL